MNVTQVEYPYSRLEILVKREKKRNQCYICKHFELVHQTHLFRLILTRIIQSLYYALLYSSSSDSADRGRSIIRVRLIWDIWAHEASLNLPLFIEVSISSQEGERSCICMLAYRNLWPLSTILIFDFGIVLTMQNYWFFHFIETNISSLFMTKCNQTKRDNSNITS